MADYRLPFTGEQVEEILSNAATQSSVTAETTRATEAEATLQSNINAVQGNLNTEATTRANADTALNTLILHVQGSLVNYYLKTETYSATEIDAMLAAIKQFRYQVVDQLPTPSADTMGIIYLVPSAHAVSGNVKDEYITLSRDEGSGVIYYFEQIGDTAVDLSNYFTKAQTNAEISAAINTALASYYTKTQVDSLIAPFITKSVNDLVNYYLKSEVFTKAEVNALIAAVQQFTYVSVQTLPTASADTMNKIYLVPSTNPTLQNVKDEFITISATDQGTTTYSWEQIGSTEVDLSGYYTSTQTDSAISTALNTALASYSTTSQMTAAIATALASYYTKTEVDALIANFITASTTNLVNYYLKSETFTKAEVNQLISAVKQFQYQSVSVLPTASASTMNIIYLVPGQSPTSQNVKDEYITISTTNEMEETVYSWEKIGTTEIDLTNYYTKTQTDSAISAAINTALADYSTTTQMTSAITAALASYYTKSEVDALIANFITASTQSLSYYSLTSETYTQAEVQQLIAAVKQFQYQSVSVLPTASASTMNIIYLVPASSPSTQNTKDEYITISTTNEMQETEYSWEKIGTTAIDLSNYYTKSQTDSAISTAINTALADYSTTSQVSALISTAVSAAIANYYTKSQVDSLIANFITKSVDDLVNYYLKSDTYTKAEVNTLIAAINQFTYQAVSTLPTASASTMNIIYLVPSSNPDTQNVKDEYITISSTNEQDVTTYSWELIGSTAIDLSNYYTKTQTDTAISTAVSGKQAIITDGAMIGLGYGVCSTAAATAAKEVTITNFLLLKNMPITVKFVNTISVASSTLNITNTGAKPLFMDGSALYPFVIMAGMTATIIYDGTNYNIVQLGYARNTPSSHIVDMSLPSGTLWSDANIDVTRPDGFAVSEFMYECSFFSWGNIVGHNPISDSAFSYNFGTANTGPYASTSGSQLTGDVPASPTYDIARAICGDPWRLPTATEFQELIDNCDFVQADGETVVSESNKLVTVNGIVGIYLKSKINGNLLFFPCSGSGYGTSWGDRTTYGCYWSGSLASDSSKGLRLIFFSGGVGPQNSDDRFNGISGRAVLK